MHVHFVRVIILKWSILSNILFLSQVINFYFNLIKERGSSGEGCGAAPRKIHVFNSFFYPKLSQAGFSGVRRWTRKVGDLANVTYTT